MRGHPGEPAIAGQAFPHLGECGDAPDDPPLGVDRMQPAKRAVPRKPQLGRAIRVGRDVEERKASAIGCALAVVLDLSAADRTGAIVADRQLAPLAHHSSHTSLPTR